jgi:rubrerythrin
LSQTKLTSVKTVYVVHEKTLRCIKQLEETMPLLRTRLLRAEPAGTLHSLDELFALANAMEQEAANKYAELAGEMQRQNRADLAAVFADLAAAEREHVDSVKRWSQSWRGKAPDPALVRWEAPKTFDDDTTAEIKASKLMTPYRALAMAVRNEERAFAFWSYLAAFAEDPEIKKAAEAMAGEELGHVATLRKARRRAYHREHDASRPATGKPEQIDAAVLERRLAGQLQQLEVGLDPAGPAGCENFRTKRGLCRSKRRESAGFPRALSGATLRQLRRR